jgi:hypothetical protein
MWCTSWDVEIGATLATGGPYRRGVVAVVDGTLAE